MTHMTPLDDAGIEMKRSKAVLASVPPLALLTAVISVSMLILWLAAGAAQQRQWPYLFLMKSDTALCLLILAIGLFGISAKGRALNFVGAACACLVIAFAAAVLTQYSLSIDLRIDQWLVADHSTDRWPGRTSVGMAISLLMIATAYLILYSSREALTAQAILLAAVGAAILYGERMSVLSNSLGFATLVTSSALFFATAVWIVTAVMLRTENAKAQAESTRDAAERRLQVGEQRLRIAVEAARLGTWEYLVESAELVTSAQCKAIYGLLPTDAFPYSNFLAAIVPDQRERVQSSAE